MDVVDHHGRTTAYRHVQPDATGPTVLYVHGSGGTHEVWAAQCSPRGPVHPAVAVDLSGHGASDDIEADAGPETVAAYAEDVVAVARATDASVVVGNSLGGAVAQTIALDGDLDLAGLVLVGTGAKLAVIEELRESLDTNFERAVEFLHGPDMVFHEVDDEAVEDSKAEMRRTGQAVTRRDLLSCHTFDVRERLEGISVPTLAIVGEHDRLTPVAYHEYFAEHIPDCDLAVVEDAAHLVMIERPDAFNDRLGSFVSRL